MSLAACADLGPAFQKAGPVREPFPTVVPRPIRRREGVAKATGVHDPVVAAGTVTQLRWHRLRATGHRRCLHDLLCDQIRLLRVGVGVTWVERPPPRRIFVLSASVGVSWQLTVAGGIGVGVGVVTGEPRARVYRRVERVVGSAVLDRQAARIDLGEQGRLIMGRAGK